MFLKGPCILKLVKRCGCWTWRTFLGGQRITSMFSGRKTDIAARWSFSRDGLISWIQLLPNKATVHWSSTNNLLCESLPVLSGMPYFSMKLKTESSSCRSMNFCPSTSMGSKAGAVWSFSGSVNIFLGKEEVPLFGWDAFSWVSLELEELDAGKRWTNKSWDENSQAL